MTSSVIDFPIIKRLINLALPVMVSRGGMLVMVGVDTAMTGHYGAQDLAYLSMGMAAFVILIMVSVGLMMGTAILTAQAHGAGEDARCGQLWRAGVSYGLALGACWLVLTRFGEEFLLLTGQSPFLAGPGGEVIGILGLGLPTMLLYIASGMYLEATQRPVPEMIAMILANVVNAGLNYLMIYGNGGFEAMGVYGAAWATTFVRWGLGIGMVLYVLFEPKHGVFQVWGSFKGIWAFGARLRAVGRPIGLAMGLEAGAFMTMVLLSGYISVAAVGAYQISQTMIAFVFMLAQGVSTATTVLVGNAVGGGDQRRLRVSAWTGVSLAMLLMAVFGLFFELFPSQIAQVFTTEAAVIAIATPTLIVAGLMLVTDGAQAVLFGALRGAGDVKVPSMTQVFSFWGVMVPSGYVFAFVMGYGAPGLMGGAMVGVTVASALLALRLRHVTRQNVARA